MSSTINDVAKLAGVSRQTVSRVINNSEAVSSEAVEKVNRAISILNYHPNNIARSLASKTVKSIGFFLPLSKTQIKRNMFFTNVTSEICQCCAKDDFVLELFTALNTDKFGILFKKLYREKRVGGLIISCPSIDNRDIIELIAADIPFVLIGRPSIELDTNFVDVDNVNAAYLVGKHFIDKGHTKIAILNARDGMTMSQDFKKGMEKAYEENGLSKEHLYEVFTDLTFESGYEKTSYLLKESLNPTAIFTADDLLAIAAKKAIFDMELKIPENVAIASATSNGWGDMIYPELTYVNTEYERLGKIAAEFLINYINGDKERKLKQVLSVNLVIGKSS